MAVSDRVAVMNGGRIEQVSAPAELYRAPATEFVAGFIGSSNRLASPDLGPGENGVHWMVRPEHVVLLPGDEGIPGRVTRVLPHGHFAEVAVVARGTELRAYVSGETPAVGADVGVRIESALRYENGVLDTRSLAPIERSAA